MHGTYIKIIVLKSRSSLHKVIEMKTEFLYGSLQDLM